ncbi:hypothetical protein, partial [Pseudomonas viridiflava]|uniref:hypothetical protein n=1 Tax=Pseudomonas viridiflava TaxID=33069 RepID=UPI0019810D93
GVVRSSKLRRQILRGNIVILLEHVHLPVHRYTSQLNQIRQLGRKPTGRFMPQIVKAQIDQEVFLWRYLRHPQSPKYFSLARSRPLTNAFLRASAVVGKTRPHSERGKSLSS